MELLTVPKNASGNRIVNTRIIHKNYLKLETSNDKLPYKVFKKMILLMFKEIWGAMIKDFWTFVPPVPKMGSFAIEERESPMHIDWKLTKEKGKLVKVPNFKTGGRLFRMFWDNYDTYYSSNMRFYKFRSTRGSKESMIGNRGIAAWIQECFDNNKIYRKR